MIIGGSLEEDAAAFVDAWHRTERGEDVCERALVFESWEALAKVLTGERFRLLKYVHAHPEPSISTLARALGRQYRRRSCRCNRARSGWATYTRRGRIAYDDGSIEG